MAAAVIAMSDDANHIATLLNALTQPDTVAIRQAEAALKPLLKDSRCVPALVEILKSGDGQSVGVRHVAAIVLRKRLAGHYVKFDTPTQNTLKAEILFILANEPVREVRKGVVGVAAVILKAAPQEWPELWQFVAAAAGSTDNEQARELAYWILAETTDTVGEHFKSHFPQLVQVFQAGLLDTSSRQVQTAALKALGQLMSYLADEPEMPIFAQLVPPLLQVAATYAQHFDDDVVAVVLDVLYDISFSPTVGEYMADIVNFGLLCMSLTELEMKVRDSGALIVATLAESKPKTFGKNPELLNRVLDTLFGLIENSPNSAAGALFESNPAWRKDLDHDNGDDGDDDDDLDEPTETSMAQGTLDMLACEVPKRFIFEPLVSRCVARLQSPNANARKAGMAGLGVIAEGCAEPLREHLQDLMPLVFSAARDADAQVRECACFALGQISEHCRPEILGYSEQILPIVFSLLDDSAVTVQVTSCYVLEMFCERLEPKAVRPLLDPLVRKLAAMLEGTTKRSVQEMVVAALAATAVAAEEEFAPYVAGISALMEKLMILRDESMYSLRGRALECMGHMAIAVGKDAFQPYFMPTMKCAVEGLALDSTELHEFAYAVFANLAKVMGEAFAPILPELVPHLITVIGVDEGQLEAVEQEAEQRELQSLAILNPQGNQFGALDDSDDEDGEGGNYVIHVRTALLEAKKGAITALGEMAAHTGAAFCPYLEESMSVLTKASNNWHPLVKIEVAEVLPSMVIPSVAAYHAGNVAWTKGEINGGSPLSEHTAAIASAVLELLIKLMGDDDKETVGKACEGVQAVIELCGPYALVPVANECLLSTHSLLTKQSPCQRADGLYGELPDDDDDHDSFMNSVCDLVGSFSRVMGGHFAQYLPQFLPAVCEYTMYSRPSNDRAMAMGCLGEFAQELGADISPHWESVFLPAIIAGLGDSDDNVKRNAAFCSGMCCEALGESIGNQYPQLLQSLSPLFSVDVSAGDSSSACVDNAAAAVSRMIMTCPSQVPMAQVLPVMLKALPLRMDMTENETVYKCLMGLQQMNHPDLAANNDELRRVFTAATSEGSDVEKDIQDQIQAALQAL